MTSIVKKCILRPLKFKKSIFMKKLRAIIYLILFLAGATVLVYLLANFVNGQLNQHPVPQAENQPTQTVQNNPADAAATEVTTSQPSTTADTTTASTSADVISGDSAISAESASDSTSGESSTTTVSTPATPVSISELGKSTNYAYLEILGTVKSSTSSTLSANSNATVKKVNFQEGDFVNAGDTIIELSGPNSNEHPSETQLKIAQTTYDNAVASLSNLQKTSNESLSTASLQLQSAVHQANAIAYDLAVIKQNQAGIDDALQILRDTLYNTAEKNDRDALKSRRDIDDLIYTLNAAQDDRARTLQKINDLETTPDSPEKTEQVAKLQSALDAQSKGIEDLYDAIDKSKYGYSTLSNTAEMSENQILGQITSSESQFKVLDLNLQSTETKLGYTGDTSDALQLAEQAYQATKVQLQTALDNAQNQLKLAKLNLDLAKNQADGLNIKAPFSGIITKLDLSSGEVVSNQTTIAELVDPKSYELELGMTIEQIDRLDASKPAQILLGTRELEVPIKSISPKVDEKTRLVTVKLQLPNILFKVNQNIKAKLPLTTQTLISSNDGSNTASDVFYIPLDAVIIGSESQFVYINDNGKAKKVEVELGEISGDQVAILSGLNYSDQIIVEGAKSLSDGQTISPK